MKPRSKQICTFCKKHSIRTIMKYHTRNCPFKTCECLCCKETRICQRFNRANTKNSRKSIGDRSLTLPAELIDLFRFESEVLEVVKNLRSFSTKNSGNLEELMSAWIEKGHEIIRSLSYGKEQKNFQNSSQNSSNFEAKNFRSADEQQLRYSVDSNEPSHWNCYLQQDYFHVHSMDGMYRNNINNEVYSQWNHPFQPESMHLPNFYQTFVPKNDSL